MRPFFNPQMILTPRVSLHQILRKYSISADIFNAGQNPNAFLALINILCAGIGMLVAIWVARALGPEQFGILAIISGIIVVTANFVDVRLVDLVSKLYYRNDLTAGENILEYRASVIQVGILIYGLISLVLFLLGFMLTYFLVNYFTPSTVQVAWMFGLSLAEALRYFASPFAYLQRFSEKFFLMGTFQLVNSILGAVVLSGSLFVSPSLTGYTRGVILVAILSTVLTVCFSVYLWVKHDRFPILNRWSLQAAPDYIKNLRFLVMTNVLGYTKMLHRAADVLLVGYFCNDRQTGLYKLARSLSDVFYVLFDAMNKVYQPTFLGLLSRKELEEYRQTASKVIVNAGWFTITAVIAEILILRWLLQLAFGDLYTGAESSIIVLTVPFFFVAGMYMWIWPVLVHTGRLGTYTLYSLVAIVIGQYGLGVFLFWTMGENIVWFAVGYLVSYVILFLGAFRYVAGIYPGLTPFLLIRS
jgi:O-antigen/teichoic acid export membrane protein